MFLNLCYMITHIFSTITTSIAKYLFLKRFICDRIIVLIYIPLVCQVPILAHLKFLSNQVMLGIHLRFGYGNLHYTTICKLLTSPGKNSILLAHVCIVSSQACISSNEACLDMSYCYCHDIGLIRKYRLC